MKSKKNLVGMILGGIGALTGIGLFTTGCGDSPHYEKVTVTVAEVEACCGTDKTSQEYNTCVQAYQANGVCSSPSPKPDDPLPDVPMYGMPDPIPPTTEQLQECCGQDDGTSEYKACVENYTDVNAPHDCYEHEPIAIYGPDPTWCCGPEWNECSNTYFNGGGCTSGIDPEESQACCAKAEDPGACVLDFIKTKKCPTDIPEPTKEELKNCCIMSNFENDAECEKKYRETGKCDNDDMESCCSDLAESGDYPKTFNAVCVSLLRKNNQCSEELKECCGLKESSYNIYNDECTERFGLLGKCPSDLNACCQDPYGYYNATCLDHFDKNNQCDEELTSCCKGEDGNFNDLCVSTFEDDDHVCIKEVDECCKQETDTAAKDICSSAMYYIKQCNDQDVLECCTEEKWNELFWSRTCIRYYQKMHQYNVCFADEAVNGGVATIYGGDFRPLPFEWCDDYKGDYEKCIDFARCDVNLQEEEAKQCCGEDDKAEGYSDCLDAYKEKGKSTSCLQPLDEGEPAPNTNPIACCGKGYTGTVDYNGVGEMGPTPWEKCVDTYVKTGECIGVPEDEPGDE